jgi:hypothetical protein
MTPKQEKALVAKIIKLHGPVIDLRKSPGVIIDILHRFADGPDGGGNPCGGVPPSPPPPPSSRAGERITPEDLMKALLALSRDVAGIKKTVNAAQAKRATTANTRKG